MIHFASFSLLPYYSLPVKVQQTPKPLAQDEPGLPPRAEHSVAV